MKVFARVLVGVALFVTCGTILDAMRPRLPTPTGPWRVGTTMLDIGIGHGRSTAARVWYPAAPDARGTSDYLYGTRGLSFRDRLIGSLARSDAVGDVGLADGTFPLIIYVPGFGGRFYHNTAQTQELASHGYVVVGIDDTESSSGFDYSTVSGARDSLAEGNRKVRVQARDVVQAIDTLVAVNAGRSGKFAGRLALDRIGIFGFSFGGAVAAEVAASDPRVRAAVDLDGSVYGTVAANGLRKPFMYGMSTDDVDTSDGPLAAEFDRTNLDAVRCGLEAHGGYLLRIDGMKHYNFTDAPIFPSIRHTGVGSIDGKVGMRIVSRYVLAFFDLSLRHVAEPLMTGSPRFDSAATLERFAPKRVACDSPRSVH